MLPLAALLVAKDAMPGKCAIAADADVDVELGREIGSIACCASACAASSSIVSRTLKASPVAPREDGRWPRLALGHFRAVWYIDSRCCCTLLEARPNLCG